MKADRPFDLPTPVADHSFGMAGIFSVQDLYEVAASVADAWREGVAKDWSVTAGTLEWSCTRTANHAVDTLLAPAFFLASRRTDRYPSGRVEPR